MKRAERGEEAAPEMLAAFHRGRDGDPLYQQRGLPDDGLNRNAMNIETGVVPTDMA